MSPPFKEYNSNLYFKKKIANPLINYLNRITFLAYSNFDNKLKNDLLIERKKRASESFASLCSILPFLRILIAYIFLVLFSLGTGYVLVRTEHKDKITFNYVASLFKQTMIVFFSIASIIFALGKLYIYLPEIFPWDTI